MSIVYMKFRGYVKMEGEYGINTESFTSKHIGRCGKKGKSNCGY